MFRSLNSSRRRRHRLHRATSAVVEQLEQRQLLAGGPSGIGGVVDLAGTSLSVTPLTAGAGGTIKATCAYKVTGSVRSDFSIQYRLSSNNVWGDSNDIVITPDQLITSSGRSAGDHTTAPNLTVPQTTSPGTYYVLAKLDSAGIVTETNENNNVIVGNTISVVQANNDAFANRLAISGSTATATGNNVGATRETGEPGHAGYAGGHSVWWKWTAPGYGRVTIDTIGSGFDTLLGVYVGSKVSALSYVASNNDRSSSSTASSVTFNANFGQTYQIAVDGRNGATGSVKLNLKQILTFPAAPAATFATTTISDGVSISWLPSAKATGYDVWRNTANSTSGATKIGSATINSFSDTTAAVNTQYWYFAKASNNGATSGFSPAARGVRVPAFTSTSGDGSKISFFNAASGTTRNLVGRADAASSTTVITVSTEKLLGVSCIRIDTVSHDPSADVLSSDSKWLAKDSSGKLWVFQEIYNGAVRFSAAALANVVPASSYSDILMRLMSGVYQVGATVTNPDGSTDQIVSTTLASTTTTGLTYVATQHTTRDGDVLWQYFTQANGLVGVLFGHYADFNAPGWVLTGFTLG